MPAMLRRTLALSAILAVASLAAACGGDSDTAGEPDDAGGSPTRATSTTVATPTSVATTTTTGPDAAGTAPTGGGDEAPAADQVVEVEVRDGEPVGGVRRAEVELGASVVVRVTSDVADEVHVHGYDRFAEVEAGGTAEVAFDAEIPGIFEVELEGRGLEILELEVRG